MPAKMISAESEYGAWASLIMRLAIAALFFSAVVPKLKDGSKSMEGVVKYFQTTFEKTWLPPAMVTIHARITPFMEALLVVWLLTGWRIKMAWIVAGLFLISLAFGMGVAGKHDVAGHNYNYVLMAVIGLYLARYDRFNVEAIGQTRTW